MSICLVYLSTYNSNLSCHSEWVCKEMIAKWIDAKWIDAKCISKETDGKFASVTTHQVKPYQLVTN